HGEPAVPDGLLRPRRVRPHRRRRLAPQGEPGRLDLARGGDCRPQHGGGALPAVAQAGVQPNLLINPDGRIDQRHASLTSGDVATADDSYGGPDRWYSLTETASINVRTLQDGENGVPYCQRLTQTQASAQRMGRAQIIEAINCRHARGQSVTLSGRIRCSSSQAIRYAILEWTGTADSVTSDVVSNWASGSYTAGGFFLGSNLTVAGVGAI